MPNITIDRCYCEDKPFAELVQIARDDDLDLIGLARQEGCGTHCGWCIAYLRRALQTGQTEFHDLLPKEALVQPHSDTLRYNHRLLNEND